MKLHIAELLSVQRFVTNQLPRIQGRNAELTLGVRTCSTSPCRKLLAPWDPPLKPSHSLCISSWIHLVR